jgi:hypothetical protein
MSGTEEGESKRVRFASTAEDPSVTEATQAPAAEAADAHPAPDAFRNPRLANVPGNSAEVEEKAHALLDQIGATSEDAIGIRNLQDLTTSIGLPAARESFEAMLDANKVTPALRAAALREIKAFSPITEVGCMQVDFFNMIKAAPDVAYLVLDKCPANHDLGAELKKLKTVVDTDKWVEVIKHLSMMIYLGRTVYAAMAKEHKPLIRQIFGRSADHDCADLMTLGVDSRNTTLFVNPRWPVRVGISVRFKAD